MIVQPKQARTDTSIEILQPLLVYRFTINFHWSLHLPNVCVNILIIKCAITFGALQCK